MSARAYERDFDLAPGIAEFLRQSDLFLPATAGDVSVAEDRRRYDALCAHFRQPRPAGVTVRDLPAEGARPGLRLYHPGAAPAPCLIYLHGGGWIVGGLDSHDDITAEIAAGAGCAVLAVDYRLAPEHRHPAALDDAWAALAFAATQAEALGLDRERLAIAGDSAGANLAAGLCLKAREEEGAPRLRGQLLIYPALGLRYAAPERDKAPEGPHLSHADMDYFEGLYFGGAAAREDPLALPLKASDLAGLPPAHLVAAEHDVLCEDAVVYAERLAAAGVPSTCRLWPGLVHAFLRARNLSPTAAAAFADIVQAARRLLA
jgi:acetyl esterase